MKNPLAITLIEQGGEAAPQVLRGELTASIRKAAALGYQALEIHVADPFLFPLEAVRAACTEHRMAVASIVTGQIYTRRGRSLTDGDKAVREAAMDEVFAYIDIAASLGATAGVTIGWVKGNRRPGAEREFDELLAAQLGRLGEYALAKGQKILVECINRYECNVFQTAGELLAYIERYGLKGIYVQLDTFHMNIEEPDPAGAIRACGKALGFMQFADSNRRYLGAGHMDFAPILEALGEIGYEGALSLECIPGPDPEETARVSRVCLENLMLR